MDITRGKDLYYDLGKVQIYKFDNDYAVFERKCIYKRIAKLSNYENRRKYVNDFEIGNLRPRYLITDIIFKGKLNIDAEFYYMDLHKE